MDKRVLTEVPDLEKIILNLLIQIPEGMVTSYKDIAVALGDGAAARAVGAVMANNEEPEKYPCWRVV
ncbi:MAG: MGMT family protein, partial [Candidatus Bipolaricaulia bacterium]